MRTGLEGLGGLLGLRAPDAQQQGPAVGVGGAWCGRTGDAVDEADRGGGKHRMAEAGVERRVLPGGETRAEGEAVTDAERGAGDRQ
ncbi:hypothetical protein AV521_41785 [Streptomyces sp. IMTB 2501]|nr:hypothetical protein AV521_41785 [Streptomyces sp. IMTB 2501]